MDGLDTSSEVLVWASLETLTAHCPKQFPAGDDEQASGAGLSPGAVPAQPPPICTRKVLWDLLASTA